MCPLRCHEIHQHFKTGNVPKKGGKIHLNFVTVINSINSAVTKQITRSEAIFMPYLLPNTVVGHEVAPRPQPSPLLCTEKNKFKISD